MSIRFPLIKLSVLITYIIMIVVNAAANILPINGITTAQVSDSYPNLFAPAGITFAIWGVIYLLLGIYTVYQLSFNKDVSKKFQHINLLFILTSIINSIWIYAWQYKVIWMTIILMVMLLSALIRIADILNVNKLTNQQRFLIKVPFGVYFGWITIATIANVTVFLVSIGWNGFGIPDYVWMIFVLFTGVIISSLRMMKDKNLAYGLVPVWAYIGILIKHTSLTAFNYKYPEVIITLLVCLVFLVFVNVYLLKSNKVL